MSRVLPIIYNLIIFLVVIGVSVFLANLASDYFSNREDPTVRRPADGTTLSTGQVNFHSATLSVEVADTPDKRAYGLMERNHLGTNSGMLFIFEDSDYHSFWMRKTKIPLDMAWLNSSYEVVHIEHSAPPCGVINCPTYRPDKPAKYVIETNSGWFKANNINVGHRAFFRLL